MAHGAAGQLQVDQEVFGFFFQQKSHYNLATEENTTVIKLWSYTLPWLDAHQGDYYGFHFLSSEQ